MIINREETLSTKHSYVIIPHDPDYVINTVNMIDENGVITEEVQEVEINESAMISSIPAYSTKIEYQEKYGTLDQNKVVKYGFANPRVENESQALKLRNQIINDNLVRQEQQQGQEGQQGQESVNLQE